MRPETSYIIRQDGAETGATSPEGGETSRRTSVGQLPGLRRQRGRRPISRKVLGAQATGPRLVSQAKNAFELDFVCGFEVNLKSGLVWTSRGGADKTSGN